MRGRLNVLSIGDAGTDRRTSAQSRSVPPEWKAPHNTYKSFLGLPTKGTTLKSVTEDHRKASIGACKGSGTRTIKYPIRQYGLRCQSSGRRSVALKALLKSGKKGRLPGEARCGALSGHGCGRTHLPDQANDSSVSHFNLMFRTKFLGI